MSPHVRSPVTEPLFELADGWRSATASSRRRLATVVVVAACVAALLLARQGTALARIGGAVLIATSAIAVMAWRIVDRRRLLHPARIVRTLARRSYPERADRVLRALSLLGADGDARADGTSAELARLHVARAIEQLPSGRIVERAARTAGRLGTAAFVAVLAGLLFAVANGWSVLEGADVLAARRGHAPVSMRWVEEVEVVARPPDYLHETERHAAAFAPVALPHGTKIAVRGIPVRSGRRLLLSDGTTEVPFVDDGAGGVVARWVLAQTTTLRVVARFGGVVIGEPEAVDVESIPDQTPIVSIEGAPRELLLLEQTQDIAIKYEATDDHGLRDVELVLRSGTREERRVLARLDGETRSDKGGYVLKLRDAFVRKSHAPIEVTVEARDNDPLTGPKWGASPALTIVPPDVGEPEARRLEALVAVRSALVDSLAWRLSNVPPADPSGRRVFLAEERRRAAADEALIGHALAQGYGGVRVPSRIGSALVAQEDKTRTAVAREASSPSADAHATVVRATERFVLVIDAVVRGLALRDARDSGRLLADVADDLALGAAQTRDGPAPAGGVRSRATVRMDAATTVLSGGAKVMARLGTLGRDLGEIVDADLLRVRRARDGRDLTHAELAARDLAARLHEPDPSFGSHGSGAGRAGGESGGAHGTPGEEGTPPDDVEQAFEQAARDVDQLAQDHAGEIGKIEQALAGATSEEELDALREEARRHAEAVRQAARALPSVGKGSDSWTSKGASAREFAEQMARSLERAQNQDAVQSGRSAVGALDEARKMLQKGGWFDDPSGEEQRRVEEARRRLDAEQTWAERQLEQSRRRAAERARKQLEQGGEEEGKLADRARELAAHGRDRGSLPQQAADSVDEAERVARQAADALKQGDAERGLERQREAQRNLEAARERLRPDDADPSGSGASGREDGADVRSDSSRVDVPKAGEHKGPEEFRRRVVRGLGQPANGSLREAVRRYAEGLLR